MVDKQFYTTKMDWINIGFVVFQNLMLPLLLIVFELPCALSINRKDRRHIILSHFKCRHVFYFSLFWLLFLFFLLHIMNSSQTFLIMFMIGLELTFLKQTVVRPYEKKILGFPFIQTDNWRFGERYQMCIFIQATQQCCFEYAILFYEVNHRKM